jgi:serine protease Do
MGMHRAARAARAFRAALGAVALATAVGAASSFAAADPVRDEARRVVVTVMALPSAGGSAERVRIRPRVASGVLFDGKGHVVTVASAVRDCDAIAVRMPDGAEVAATLVGLDHDSGIALLQLPPGHPGTAPRFSASAADPKGRTAFALAATAGRHPDLTRGVVRRRYDRPLGSVLLLSNEVYPGYSGGPVLDDQGALLGLVLGRLGEIPVDWDDAPAAGEGASFALAGDDLRTIVSHLEQYGRVRRGFLGVRMVQGEIFDSNRPDDPFRIGVRVEEVVPGGPAAQVDLRPGDLIVGWNGETLQSPEDLMRRVEGSPPGTVVPLVWVRDEERREGRLVVGAKPDDELLAIPTRGEPEPARVNEAREQLLERMRALRRTSPATAPDSTGRPRSGG